MIIFADVSMFRQLIFKLTSATRSEMIVQANIYSKMRKSRNKPRCASIFIQSTTPMASRGGGGGGGGVIQNMHICVQGGWGVMHHVYVHTYTISFDVFAVFETQINHVFEHYFITCGIVYFLFLMKHSSA